MSNKIAVVGMACRFPGAKNINEYWSNLLSGKDTITHFTDSELADFEANYDDLKDNPEFVKAKGIIEDIDKFDPSFFGMTPAEAAGTDPQQRIWLQTAWQALENAGCDPFSYQGAIGVFAGGTLSTYLLNNVLRSQEKLENFLRFRGSESYQILTSNDPSFISTKTAYKFNLKGPAINVQTACSTSLVAISLACQSLYSYESDVCLAGGVCITVPQETGYIYQEGAIPSPDGYCRPFDVAARGTVSSNGVGVVVLKRLEDALSDGDVIYAVVRGWALNNDGNNKVSYTAPSVDGQAEVIMMAQAFAEVSPEEIGYIEAHGTGTPLGDPIEIAGLTKAFSRKTDKKQFCGIGSVKSNIGHTDTASGVASFIKSCLAAYHKTIPPTIHYSSSNLNIDFENSPFYVQENIKKWNDEKPLVIGVSSFGIGGTNAHVILEEPPVKPESGISSQQWPELFLLSAKSEDALERRKRDFVEFIKGEPDINIGDVAYSLGVGRSLMKYRSFAVASSVEEITAPSLKFTDGKSDESISGIAFMFPGQGAQYIGMGRDLYFKNNLFRQILDDCFHLYTLETGRDLKTILFKDNESEEDNLTLSATEITQPALFITEYALAKVLEQFNIRPDYMIGHSIGEYVAACLAGVFDLHTALKIVIKRGQLMQSMPGGKMMAVRTSSECLRNLNDNKFEIAADNAQQACTISLKTENTGYIENLLAGNGITHMLLNTSHAFHSEAFEPVLDEFRHYVNGFNLKAPSLPFISCLTGDFITNTDAVSGDYWARQLRNTVRFRQGISAIAETGDVAFLEVGPDTHLSSLTRQNDVIKNKATIIPTLGKQSDIDERCRIIAALGNMFNLGIKIDSKVLANGSELHKVTLPSYPFESGRYWLDYKPAKIIITKTPDKVSVNEIHDDHLNNKKVLSCEEKIQVKENETDIIKLNPVEEVIHKIWTDAFMKQNISVTDNFFEIGGDSLMAVTVMSKIKSAFKINLSLKVFLRSPRIKELAESVEEQMHNNLS